MRLVTEYEYGRDIFGSTRRRVLSVWIDTPEGVLETAPLSERQEQATKRGLMNLFRMLSETFIPPRY